MPYEQRPIQVEAFRYGHDLWPDWFQTGLSEGRIQIIESDDDFVIPGCMVEGERQQFCSFGDYLIRYEDGEIVSMGRERFELRFSATPMTEGRKAPKSVLVMDVPTMLRTTFGRQVEVELHFVDGSCQPYFRKGFERDRHLREKVMEALYESELFRPLDNEQAKSLIERVIHKHMHSELRLEI